MVDTIAILVRWKLSAEIVEAIKATGCCRIGGWYFHTDTGESANGDTRVRILARHETLRITARGHAGFIERVQASLPRILHGYNGRLITSPRQLDESLELLFTHLHEIATPVIRLIEFLRVDLVLNLPGDPRRWVLAHRGARHPWVRNADVQFGNNGIRFPGKKRVLHIYWKQKERADKSGFKLPPLAKSVRAELQLNRKDVVRKAFGHAVDEPVRHLDFNTCYGVYREAWCLFDKGPRIVVPAGDCTLHAVIAEGEAQGFKTSWGCSLMEWYELGEKKPATVNRLKGEVQRRKQEIMEFTWAVILPKRFPDPVVDIYADGREVLVYEGAQP